MFSVFLGVSVSIALLFLVGLASRIPDSFSQLKNIILTSANLRHKLFSGKAEAISYVGLVQILSDLADNFYVTALGCIKIEKSIISTMLCAFVTYGAIMNQMP